MKNRRKKKSQKRTDDLLRLVLIPVILLILTEIVKGQNLISITSYSIIALIIFFIIYVDLQYILQLKFFFSDEDWFNCNILSPICEAYLI